MSQESCRTSCTRVSINPDSEGMFFLDGASSFTPPPPLLCRRTKPAFLCTKKACARHTSFGPASRPTSRWPGEAWCSTCASGTSWRRRTPSWRGVAAATTAPTSAPRYPALSSRWGAPRRPPTSLCRWPWRRARGRGGCLRRRLRHFSRRFRWASSGPRRSNIDLFFVFFL